jgi:CRP-like cAMP-binding protein
LSDSFNLIIQFSKLLFIVLFIAHWGACFWYFIGISEFNEKGTSWISESDLLNASTTDQYITSIYYFITTMTTVGYGDITPITMNEKLYAMFSMLIACGVFAYVIGSIGTVLSSRYDEEMIFKQKIMYVDQFLRNKNLTKNVRTKVRRYLEHVLENKREQKVDESEILTLLNKNLKEEVIMHLNGLLLKNKTFGVINKYDEFCILLTSIMREETLNPGDMIFQKGDHSLRLYFINNGIVTMFDQETKIIFKELNNVSPQNCFGEIGFFAGQKRCCSAESLTFSNLTYILIDLFKEMAYKFRQLHLEKFKNFEEDLLKLRVDIREKNYNKLNLKCYLCEGNSHIAADCMKLKNISEYFFFKFRDRRHKSEQEIKRIFDYVSQNSGSCYEDRRKSILSYPSFTKNTNDVFFSFADVDQENSVGVGKNQIKSESDKSESEHSQNSSDRSKEPENDEQRSLNKSKISENSKSNKSSKSSQSSKLFYMNNNSGQIDKSTSQKREANINTIEVMDEEGVNKGILLLNENITDFKKLKSKDNVKEDV